MALPLIASSSPSTLPFKDIPSSYGLPLFGPLKDRLDFFWFQGENEFWASRMKKFNSTVFRTNVPPSPPGFPASSVIMLLDQKSFPILFDTEKVEKRDLLLANYIPSTAFYGGIRPCAFLDPSEERHFKLKSFCFDLIKSSTQKWIPEFEKAMSEAFPVWENGVATKGEAGFNSEAGQIILNVLLGSIVGRDPRAPGEASLENQGTTCFGAWLAPQLAPIANIGLPHILEELLIHTVPIPFVLVEGFYKRLEKFFRTYANELLDSAEATYALDRDDALHNLIFFIGFNAYGGLSILFPSIMGYVGQAGKQFQAELVKEVRNAVKAERGLTVRAIQSMPLVRSTVYEVLRMAPPVPYQYGRAKTDLVIESHDARFQVKKGEILGGCQPFAERDPFIFEDPDTFKPGRFMGAEGEKLLQYVVWGNGPANGEATLANKQCAANHLVPFLSHLFLATFFLRYDAFSIKDTSTTTITFSSLILSSSSASPPFHSSTHPAPPPP